MIADFSLAEEPGQTVAIVGPTGARKNTVVNLLMRFYEIDGGGRRGGDPQRGTGCPRRPLRAHAPDGYATVLDDDALNISAGPMQLLTMVRAFLADPPVLILDYATSNVTGAQPGDAAGRPMARAPSAILRS